MLRARSPGSYCLDCDTQLIFKNNKRWYCPDCKCFPPATRIIGVGGKKVEGIPANEQSGDFITTFR